MEQVATDRSLPESSPQHAGHARGASRRRGAGSRVLEGLVALVEGQRQFADEMGLAPARVFPRTHDLFENAPPREALRRLLRGQGDDLARLDDLFADLGGHQLALMAALEQVSGQAMDALDPGQFVTAGPLPLLRELRAWQGYRNHWAELRENDLLRYERMVASGFVPAYVRAREKEGALKS